MQYLKTELKVEYHTIALKNSVGFTILWHFPPRSKSFINVQIFRILMELG